jgi:hypothetical protein
VRKTASHPPRPPRALYIVKPTPDLVIPIFPSPWTRHFASYVPCTSIYVVPCDRLVDETLHVVPLRVKMTIPAIGDILTLSQEAWRIGRAFTADRRNAPIEFQEVESKISDLARALKQLAEALHDESEASLLHDANDDVQHGIELVMESCKRTVNDLDSLVDHSQVIKKHRTVGGFAIERSWSDLVLAQYNSMMWTAEGGDLHSLQELLQMHTSSISLLTQALQR